MKEYPDGQRAFARALLNGWVAGYGLEPDNVGMNYLLRSLEFITPEDKSIVSSVSKLIARLQEAKSDDDKLIQKLVLCWATYGKGMVPWDCDSSTTGLSSEMTKPTSG